MAKKISAQFKRDVAALAAYEPRAQALRWLAEGRIEDYFVWASGDGYVAAHGKPEEHRQFSGLAARRYALTKSLPLDDALVDDRMAFGDTAAARLAVDSIELFGAIALEVALVLGSPEAFERALGPWAEPAARFASPREREHPDLMSGQMWHRALAHPKAMELLHMFPGHGHFLLLLAVLLGKLDQAEAMVRLGVSPTDSSEWMDCFDAWRDLLSLADAELEQVVGFSREKINEASQWFRAKRQLASALDNALMPDGQLDGAALVPARAKAIQEALALLDQGAPVGAFALSKASEWGEVQLLERMFKSGANPNQRAGNGIPLLARMESSKLTEPVLQMWLDYGANPTMGPDAEAPFGSGMCPSPLYQWAFEGKLDLIKQAATRAVGPVPLRFTDNRGNTYAELLAVALWKGHVELAHWLIAEGGCRLDDLEEDRGEPCSAMAKPDVLAKVIALLDKDAVGAAARIPEDSGGGVRTKTL